MDRFRYPARLTAEPDGRVMVSLRDLGGAATDGADLDEARAEATDLVESLLAEYLHEGADIPWPSAAMPGEVLVQPSVTTAFQLELYRAMRHLGVDATSLGDRLDCGGAHVASLIDLAGHPRLHDLERALAALGRRISITTVAAE